MQIVEPIDIEDALRIDVGGLLDGIECFAAPAPDDLKAGSVEFRELSGFAETAVSHGYDLSIDAWAATPGAAMALANKVQGIVNSLPLREFASGRCYATATARTPYQNPDPKRPLIPRCTFMATVGIRGNAIEF